MAAEHFPEIAQTGPEKQYEITPRDRCHPTSGTTLAVSARKDLVPVASSCYAKLTVK